MTIFFYFVHKIVETEIFAKFVVWLKGLRAKTVSWLKGLFGKHKPQPVGESVVATTVEQPEEETPRSETTEE